MDTFFKDTTLATVEVLLPVWRDWDNSIPHPISQAPILNRCFKKQLVMPLDLLLIRGPVQQEPTGHYEFDEIQRRVQQRNSDSSEFLFTFEAAGDRYSIRRLFMNKNNILTVLLIGIHPQLDRIDLDATLATEGWKIAEDVCI